MCGSSSVVKRAQDAAFGLPTQPQQNKIVPRKNGVDDLRYDRVIVAHNAGKNGRVAVLAQTHREVLAQFVLDVPHAQTFFGKWTVAQIRRACAEDS